MEKSELDFAQLDSQWPIHEMIIDQRIPNRIPRGPFAARLHIYMGKIKCDNFHTGCMHVCQYSTLSLQGPLPSPISSCRPCLHLSRPLGAKDLAKSYPPSIRKPVVSVLAGR